LIYFGYLSWIKQYDLMNLFLHSMIIYNVV
jgi:hypothetical protein